jgi:hypothetical protein
VHAHDPPVGAVGRATYEPARLEAGDHAAHRGRGHLLAPGERAERVRPAEDKHGERGRLGRRQAHGYIRAAQATHEVDGDRVPPERERGGLRTAQVRQAILARLAPLGMRPILRAILR